MHRRVPCVARVQRVLRLPRAPRAPRASRVPRPPGVSLVSLAVLLAACAPIAAVAQNAAGNSAPPGIDRLRAATRPFHALDSAVAVGYAPTVADCLVHEHHGAMGYHHVNRSYLDAKAEIERPEILLFERLQDGTYRLNGVEYIVPYAHWPRDSVAPTIFGQSMKREDNLKFWYCTSGRGRRTPMGCSRIFTRWSRASPARPRCSGRTLLHRHPETLAARESRWRRWRDAAVGRRESVDPVARGQPAADLI